MDVSIIIVNYNTTDLLIDCINSVYEKTFGINFEIIVVDNFSKDSPKSLLSLKFPQVLLIESKSNLGFGRANNLGVKSAKGEFIFLLNSDTLLINNAVFELYKFWNENPSLKLGAIGGNLYTVDNRPNFSYSIYFPNILTIFLHRFRYFKFAGLDYFNFTDSAKEVKIIIGADLFLKKEIFQKLNGFDEKYFMYVEEGDLQYRLQKMELKVFNVPAAKIYHMQGSSSSSLDKLWMEISSYRYFFYKFKGRFYSSIYMLGELFTSIIFIIVGLILFNKRLFLVNLNVLLKMFYVK